MEQKKFIDLPVIYNCFTKECDIVNSDKNVKTAIVVFSYGSSHHAPVVYDTTGLNDEEAEHAVKTMVQNLTRCCNWDYEFIEKIDNIYFFK